VEQAVNLSQPLPQSSRDLIGQSKPIQRLRETISKLARSQAPVLVSGESGTGKELVARLIHEQGARASRAFVPVNCGAIPQELIESELFGHVKGSFTGAYSDKVGLFEAADGGTLFLDELGELPLPMQVKLLRAVQEKRIRRVGAAQESAIDCRVLSATNRDLAKLVATGSFRQDLYYRLNVIEVKVPALRERGEDLALLVRHFLLKFGRSAAGDALPLSPDAWAALQGYAFPGNVRQLENICHWLTVMAPAQVIESKDLPPEVNVQRPQASPEVAVVPKAAEPALPQMPGANDVIHVNSAAMVAMPASANAWEQGLENEAVALLGTGSLDVWDVLTKRFESRLILAALANTKGRRIEAAHKLGIGRNTITRKIQELGLE
jgi:two-component system nitrogen regulation response regulator GlnG